MANMKKEKRKRMVVGFIAIFLAAVMIIGMVAPFLVRAATNGVAPISVVTEAGMNGIYKVNRPMPVNIFLQNDGADFTGEVQIKVNQTGDPGLRQYIVYSYPIELNQGGSKKIEMDVTIPAVIRELKIDINDNKGKNVLTKNVTLKGISEEGMLFGVLSDEQGELDYFKSMTFFDAYHGEDIQMADRLIYMDEENLKLSEYTLNNLTTLIINNYDTSKLSGEQLTLLNDWIHNGGNLIIGTGPNFDKVFKNIGKNIMPAARTGTLEIESLTDPNNFYDSIDFSETPIHAAKLETSGAPVPVIYSDETPVSYYYKSGMGTVLLHCFDLGLAPVSTNYTAKAILNNVYNSHLSTAASQYSNRYDGIYTHRLNDISTQSDSILRAIFMLIIVYIAFIGPVLYFVLKKMDKREKGWAIIPFCAFFTTLIIFLLSRGSMYTKPIINNINDVSLVNGVTTATADMNFVALTPDKGDINVSFSRSMSSALIPGGYYDSYYAYNQPQSHNSTNNVYSESDVAKIQYGEKPSLTFYNSMSWKSNFYKSKETVDLHGGIVADIYIEDNTLKGRIINNTPMRYDELILCYNYFYKVFQDVQPNQEIDIDLELDYNNADYLRIMSMPHMFGDLMMGIVQNDLNYTVTGNTDQQREDRRVRMVKSNIISNFISARESGYVLNGVYDKYLTADIYAFNNEDLVQNEMLVNNKQTNFFTLNAFSMKAGIDIGKTEKIEFPYGALKPDNVDSDQEYYFNGNDGVVFDIEPQFVSFEFFLPTGLKAESIEFESYQESNGGAVEIYNATEQTWQAVGGYGNGTPDAVLEIYNEDYVGDSNSIIIRYAKPYKGTVYYPKIKLSCERQ